jgi:beta-lactamase regulating signal transducer with metallopeptidase domain
MFPTSAFLGSQLTAMALRGTIILALAGLCAQLLRKSSAAARHLTWRLALVAVLVTPVLSAVLPAWQLPLPAASTRELVPDLYLSHPPGEPQSITEQKLPTLAARVRALPSAALYLGRDSQVSWPLSANVLCVVFLAGLLFCLFRIALGWLGVRRLLARSMDVTEPGWTQLVQSLSQELALTRRVRLVRTTEQHTPLCAGIVHPTVVLPVDAPSWSLQRRRVVLLHELAHIQRRDCLMQLLAQLACAVHWFNPLCWLAARRLRVERELACDDLVLMVGTRPSEYAGHLLAMAGSGGLPGQLQVGIGMVGRSPLEHRVTALLDRQRSHHPLNQRSVVVAGIVTVALLLPVVSIHAQTALAPLPAAMVSSLATVATPPTAETPALLPAVQRYLAQNPLAKSESGQQPLVELTIDPKLQQIVENELETLLTKWQASGATAIILAPASGDILAMASRTAKTTAANATLNNDPDHELAVHTAYEPGSTMKVFTVATALELHTITPEQIFDCENGKWQTGHGVLQDASPHGALSVAQILAVSSNIGAQKIYRTFGRDEMGRALNRFHFGERPAVQLLHANPGVLPAVSRWSEEQAASIASGQGLSASPLQTAAAFAAIANRGVYKAPTLIRRITAPTGNVLWSPTTSGERVVSAATATTVLRLLESVVQGPMGTGQGAQVPGYLVAGKTGTAKQSSPSGAYTDHFYGSFVGAIPARQPAVVILVGVDGPRGDYTGGTVAAPAFSRLAQQAMRHLAVTPDNAR